MFTFGSYVGKTFKEIEDAQIFGKNVFSKARQGKWNTKRRLQYDRRLRGTGKDQNPYIMEVGFFDDKLAAYFIIQKRSLERGLRMNSVEVTGLLYKVASDGVWRVDAGEAGSKGTSYQFAVGRKKGVLFAFHTPNKRQLLIYTPDVAPNLGGMSAAASALLR